MSPSMRIVISLIGGLAIGAGLAASGVEAAGLVAGAEVVGTLWLNALRMTIIPLVFALLVCGVVAAASAASAGGVAGRSIVLFVVLLAIGAGVGVGLSTALLEFWPIPVAAAEALRTSAVGLGGGIPAPPEGSAFWRNIIPTNPVKAAADGGILALVVFALFFGFALTRLAPDRQAPLVAVFRSLADTMLVIVGWVLWAAPLGVFALAMVVGARTGMTAAGALAHYLASMSAIAISAGLLAYPLALLAGRTRFSSFARAAAPAQAVAASTQSSLASLPAMLKSAEQLAIPTAVSGVTLPLAVTLFRITNPLVNVSVAIYVAAIYGVELGAAALAAGALVAFASNFSAVGVSSQVNFFTTLVPIFLVMGVPIELLALLIAVETIPDVFRTVSNVTMDLAVTLMVARRRATDERTGPAEASVIA